MLNLLLNFNFLTPSNCKDNINIYVLYTLESSRHIIDFLKNFLYNAISLSAMPKTVVIHCMRDHCFKI